LITQPKDNPERIRVLLIGPSLDILGGQAVQAQRLLELLGKEPSLQVEFLPVNPRLPGPFRLLQRIKYVRTLLTFPYYLLTLLLHVPRYAVLHIFSASYSSYLLAPLPAILIGRLYGKKLVVNYRSGEAEDHLRGSQVATRTLAWAQAIVVPSGYLVDVFARFGLVARSIFNTVPIERFSHRARTPLRPVFLSNRNFDPMYNVGNTLEAFGLIQKQFPAAALTVAGDGAERERLHSLAERLQLRNVTFLGAVKPSEMFGLYESADIYLNSSEIDNMPNSIIEAYAAGTPVVTTNAGGIPYIVKHEETGLMIPCRQPQAMAAAAVRLLEDQEFASRLAAVAREECARYTWERIRPEWLALYRGLGRS
jgi:glycosyltransferase involved in cell wall biosynthesis